VWVVPHVGLLRLVDIVVVVKSASGEKTPVVLDEKDGKRQVTLVSMSSGIYSMEFIDPEGAIKVRREFTVCKPPQIFLIGSPRIENHISGVK